MKADKEIVEMVRYIYSKVPLDKEVMNYEGIQDVMGVMRDDLTFGIMVAQATAEEIVKHLEQEETNNNIYRNDADTQNENNIEWIKKKFGVKHGK